MVDIKIRRKMHINTGNFTNIESDVELVLKDIEEKDYWIKFNMLSKIIDASQAIECHGMLSEMEAAKLGDGEAYKEMLEQNIGAIQQKLNNLVKKLDES